VVEAVTLGGRRARGGAVVVVVPVVREAAVPALVAELVVVAVVVALVAGRGGGRGSRRQLAVGRWSCSRLGAGGALSSPMVGHWSSWSRP
jgi:hypothetical protein